MPYAKPVSNVLDCYRSIADQLVGLAFVLRGCGGNYRCGNSEISTCHRRNGAAAEGRFDAIRSPGEQPSEKLGV